MTTHAIDPLPAHADDVPRIAAPSPDVFERDWVRAARPVVITGVVDRWPAFRRWSFDDLARRFGDVRVTTAPTRAGRMTVSEIDGLAFERIGPARCIEADRSASQSCPYVSAPLDEFPRSFLGELDRPAYCRSARWYRPKFWLGRAGNVTPLHWDVPQNLSAQVFGRKRWILYPPGQWSSVYPCPPWSRSPNFSRVDPERPDFTRFPRFSRLRPLVTVLAPGEMLYIPSRWWHHVRSLDDNAALSFWYGGVGYALAGSASHALKRTRGLYRGEWG